MRSLRAFGAPFALFGFLFQLLLPVSTAVAHQLDPAIAQVEICTRVGVKQLPASLADLAVPPDSAGGGEETATPTAKPEYCPGAGPSALAPAIPTTLLAQPLAGRIEPARPDRQAPPRGSAAPGLGSRGPPADA